MGDCGPNYRGSAEVRPPEHGAGAELSGPRGAGYQRAIARKKDSQPGWVGGWGVGSGLGGAHEQGGRSRAGRQGKSGAGEGRAEKEAREPPTPLRKSVGWGAEWTRMREESMSVWEEKGQESSPCAGPGRAVRGWSARGRGARARHSGARGRGPSRNSAREEGRTS